MEDTFHGKTVVVTGASGYIAAALLARLRRIDTRVLAISRRALGRDGIESRIADVRTPECWRDLVNEADVIVHLAGNTSVCEAARDPDATFQATVLPLVHLAAAARAAGRRPRVIHASTATVYGFTDRATAETAAPKPQTVYDSQKLAAEQQLDAASQDGAVDGISLRLANVYGPSPAESSARDRGFLNRAAEQAVRGGDLTLYGDGSYVRDFVHLDDVVSAMLAAASSSHASRCFNVGSGVGTSLRDALSLVADAAARSTGRRVAIRDTAWPPDSDPIERRSFVANIDRIRVELGWRPLIALVDGIATLTHRELV